MRNNSIEGLPIIDAKAPVVLTITPGDIRKADPKDPGACAAARACWRQFRVEARVHMGRVYVRTAKDHWTRYLTPPSLRTEIVAFDRGGTFQPGNYVLPAPQPSKRLGKATGTDTNKTPPVRKNAKSRAPRHIFEGVRHGPG